MTEEMNKILYALEAMPAGTRVPFEALPYTLPPDQLYWEIFQYGFKRGEHTPSVTGSCKLVLEGRYWVKL